MDNVTQLNTLILGYTAAHSPWRYIHRHYEMHFIGVELKLIFLMFCGFLKKWHGVNKNITKYRRRHLQNVSNWHNYNFACCFRGCVNLISYT